MKESLSIRGDCILRNIKIYPERLEYNTGETIRGFVEILSDSDFDFTEMYVEFVCKEHTYFTQGSGDDEESFSESYYHHTERMTILPAGRFQDQGIRVPFAFSIPQNLPTSYDGSSGWIEHTLEAKIGLKWRLDPKDSIKIIISGQPTHTVAEPVRQSLVDEETSLLDVEIEKNEVYLGEDISINYRVDEILDIRGIRFDLRVRELAVAEGEYESSEKCLSSVYIDEREIPRRSWSSVIIPTDSSMLASYRGPLITLTVLLKIILDRPWRLDKDLQIEMWTVRTRNAHDTRTTERDELFDL